MNSEKQISRTCEMWTIPLCGENGAACTFGAQKGGTPKIPDRPVAGMKCADTGLH